MLDNSAYYGLQNPAFTKDIGYSMIDSMYPAAGINTLTGTIDLEPNQAANLLNKGQPANDTYTANPENKVLKRNKEDNIVKKVFIALGLLAVGALAFFKCKAPVKNAISSIKNSANGLWNKASNLASKVINKFKKTTSP